MADTLTEAEQRDIWDRALGIYNDALDRSEPNQLERARLALIGPYGRMPEETAGALIGYSIGIVDGLFAMANEMTPDDFRDAFIGSTLIGRLLGREIDAALAAREARA